MAARKTATLAAAALAALALALAGCSSSSSSAPAAQAPASQPAATATAAGPANPVPLIIKAGAVPKPGERHGTTSADGWLYADGTLSRGSDTNESLTLYTLPAGLTGQQAIAQTGVSSSDSQTLIAGPDWFAYLYPAENVTTGAVSYPVPPATVAARLHGTVVPPPA